MAARGGEGATCDEDTRATEELRARLDARGAAHDDLPGDVTHTVWRGAGGTLFMAHDALDPEGRLLIVLCQGITVAQAVETSLGPGSCKLDGYADARLSVCQSPDETGSIDYAEVCECTACGASVIVPHEYERISSERDELWPKYNFCPGCGRRVGVG